MDENRNNTLTSILNRQIIRFGKDIVLNGKVARCIPYKEEHKIKLHHMDKVQLYSIFNMDGTDYIITDREQIEDVCVNYIYQPLHHVIKVKYTNMDLILLPSVVKDISNSIAYGEPMAINNFRIEIYTQRNTTSNIVTNGTRVVVFGSVYKVINITYENNEILKLSCESDQQQDLDDIVNEIANNTLKPKTFYNLSVKCGENGLISPLNGTYLSGSIITFNITPNNGYIVDKFIINGTEIDLNNTLSYSMTINDNINADISFKLIPKQFTIDVIQNNCTVVPSIAKVYEGDDETFTITPNDGYKIDKVLLDTVDITNQLVDNAITITNVLSNHTLTVNCKQGEAKKEIVITPVYNESTYYNILEGDTVTFTATKLINNVDSGESLTITYTNPDKIDKAYLSITISGNTFRVKNLREVSGKYIHFNVKDSEGLSVNYKVALGGLW